MTSGLGHEDVVGNLIKKGFFEGSVLFEWVKKKKGNEEVETEYKQLFQEVLLQDGETGQ